MNRPENYESISIDYTALEPGPHKCTIKQAEEYTSTTGKAMLRLYIDTTIDDSQPGFYAAKYKADKRKEKKWGGIWNVYVESDDFGDRNLKRLVTAVEDSTGTKAVWGDRFCDWLKGKTLGIVFRLEEYRRDDYSIGVSLKPFYGCDIKKLAEQKMPEVKRLKEAAPAPDPWAGMMPDLSTPLGQEGFIAVPDSLADEGLPFN
jgi:hypothetical protein